MEQKHLFLALLFAFGINLLQAQTMRYVKETGSENAQNAISWNSACNNLQAVIDISTSGDHIYVASGTYKGSFIMKDGVSVLGGFPADADNNTTINDRQLPSSGRNFTILDGEKNHRPLTQFTPFNFQTLWDGFVIRNGKATGHGTPVYGPDGKTLAGVLCSYDASTGKGMVISTNEQDHIKWSTESVTTKANDKQSGLKNLDVMKAYISNISNQSSWEKYPAWKWVKEYKEGGYTDWYMPSRNELEYIYENRQVIEASFKSLNKAPFKEGMYWSSSENDHNYTWVVLLKGGGIISTSKQSDFQIRALRVFNLFHYLSIDPYFSGLNGGGAFLLKGGVLSNCIVENCKSNMLGGGVFAGTGAHVENCSIINNLDLDGAGLYETEASLTNNIVENNITSQSQLKPSAGKKYKVGDVYTFPNNEKGIVFYVDETGEHGWAISMKENTDGSGTRWLPKGKHNIPGVTVAKDMNTALSDTAGYANTKAIREYLEKNFGKDKEKYAAYNVDMNQGWFLPSAGQLQKLYEVLPAINAALVANDGVMLESSSAPYYWSSTQDSSSGAWYVNFFDGYLYDNKMDNKILIVDKTRIQSRLVAPIVNPEDQERRKKEAEIERMNAVKEAEIAIKAKETKEIEAHKKAEQEAIAYKAEQEIEVKRVEKEYPKVQEVVSVSNYLDTTTVGDFKLNAYALSPSMKTVLDKEITLLKSNPKLNIICEGHTCDLGNNDVNKRYGLKRAQAASTYLIENGIAKKRIKTVSKGKENPIVKNDSEENRKKNRRIVIIITQ